MPKDVFFRQNCSKNTSIVQRHVLSKFVVCAQKRVLCKQSLMRSYDTNAGYRSISCQQSAENSPETHRLKIASFQILSNMAFLAQVDEGRSRDQAGGGRRLPLRDRERRMRLLQAHARRDGGEAGEDGPPHRVRNGFKTNERSYLSKKGKTWKHVTENR